MEEEHTQVIVEKPKQKLGIPASILIAGLMISFSIYFTGTHANSTGLVGPNPSGDAVTTGKVDVKDVATAQAPFIGDANAPLAMAYWSDYQCPFCKKTEIDVVPTLKSKYVDTGKMKIIFKDFAFLGEDSKTAALFGHAVWNLYPSQYFDWREAMYKAQDAEGDQGFGDRASIETLTRTISGIDQAKVSANVDANGAAYQKLIDADYAEGQKLGVTGTPAVIIGSSFINGAQPLASFTTVIEGQLK